MIHTSAVKELDEEDFYCMQGSKYSSLMLKLGAAEFHWHFVQGMQAIDSELYIPGSICLLNGIESSIRVTMYQIENFDIPTSSDLDATFSNSLLRCAWKAGINIETLQFPGEADFKTKLKTRSEHVRVVKLRHDFAHGNITDYIERDLGLFTPECLREISHELVEVTRSWIDEIADFRKREFTT